MAEILLYGIIGDPADGLDSASVTGAVRNSTGPLSVRINSPGGYVMEGLAILAALRAYTGPVTVYIDGLAASMASVIAMVGSEVIMAESALLMVHKPWDSTVGNANDMRNDAALLDKIEQQMIGIYAQRTGLPEADLAVMLAAETWFTAEEALAAGFVTSIAAPLKLAAMAKATGYGFRHLPERLKDTPMPDTPQAVLDERARVSTIQSLIDKHRLPAAMATEMIANGTALPAAREVILDTLASRSDAMRIGGLFGGGQTLDNPAVQAKAIGDALFARLSGAAPEGPAAAFMSCSMVDMARALVETRGARNARGMRSDDVLDAAAWNRGKAKAWANDSIWTSRAEITHTTSDFPDLLTASGQRFLEQTYLAAASPLKLLGRERQARDFRPIFGLQLSNFGVLNTVGEGGEIKSGTFTARKESYALETFAKQFSLTRQAIINDDLGAFADVMTIMARAAAETEAQALAALLNANPAMGDGKPLFCAEHHNFGPAALPTVANLDLGRLAMRTQKDMDGVTPTSTAPKYVLSAPGQETAIEMLVSIPLNPTQTSEANPFAGKLTPLVDPRLAGTAWYLFADPGLAPVLEYANLNGFRGPQVEMQQGWDVLGQAFRVYEDFGCGFVDYRGAFKFPSVPS